MTEGRGKKKEFSGGGLRVPGAKKLLAGWVNQAERREIGKPLGRTRGTRHCADREDCTRGRRIVLGGKLTGQGGKNGKHEKEAY